MTKVHPWVLETELDNSHPIHPDGMPKESDTRRAPKSRFALLGALLLAGAVSGCATIEKCGLEDCPDDRKITGHVEAMLKQHPVLGPNLLRVQTLNHVVYLNGLVESDLQSDTAEAVAQNVKGVEKVVNNISVDNN